MRSVDFGKGGEVGHGVDLSEELANDFAGILALTQAFDLAHRPRERLFRALDRDVGEILPLAFEAPMMFQKLFAEELRETLTGRTAERLGEARRIDAGQATVRGHFLYRADGSSVGT